MAKLPKINTGFICLNCGKKNIPAIKTCRNHCAYCLFSRHLDECLPGDRQSNCKGEMRPISILTGHRKADFVIEHECERCGKRQRNYAASDDNRERMYEIAAAKVFKEH